MLIWSHPYWISLPLSQTAPQRLLVLVLYLKKKNIINKSHHNTVSPFALPTISPWNRLDQGYPPQCSSYGCILCWVYKQVSSHMPFDTIYWMQIRICISFITDLILLEFSKAFDKVSHEKLALKLHDYGIRGSALKWVKGFIDNRHQSVIVNGSSRRVATCTQSTQLRTHCQRRGYFKMLQSVIQTHDTCISTAS